jgi:hypothetical protein
VKRRRKPIPIADAERCFTIAEFCASANIGRTQYYALKRDGRGPREMKIGASIRISPEARAAWRALMEA